MGDEVVEPGANDFDITAIGVMQNDLDRGIDFARRSDAGLEQLGEVVEMILPAPSGQTIPLVTSLPICTISGVVPAASARDNTACV